MNKVVLISLAVVLALNVGLVGCAGVGEEEEEEEVPTDIKIGAVRSLTGNLSSIGDYAFGPVLDYWVDEVNAAGGIYVKEYDKSLPVKLDIQDDNSDPAMTASLLSDEIMSGDYDFVFGPVGTDSLQLAALTVHNTSIIDYLKEVKEKLGKLKGEYEKADQIKQAIDLIDTLLKEPDPSKLDLRTLEILEKLFGLIQTINIPGVSSAVMPYFGYLQECIILAIKLLGKVDENFYQLFKAWRDMGSSWEDFPNGTTENRKRWELRYQLEKMQEKLKPFKRIVVSDGVGISITVDKKGAKVTEVSAGTNVDKPTKPEDFKTEAVNKKGEPDEKGSSTRITGASSLKDPEGQNEEENSVVIKVDPEGSTVIYVVDIVPLNGVSARSGYGPILLGAEGGCTSVMNDLVNLPYFFGVLNFANHNQMEELFKLFEDWQTQGKAPNPMKVYIVYSDDLDGFEYRDEFVAEAANYPGQFNIVGNTSIELFSDNVTGALTDARGLGVDAFCAFACPQTTMAVVGQAIAMGINFDAMVLSWGANFQYFYDTFGPATEGIIGFGAWNEDTSAAAAAFAAGMIANCGRDKMDWWGGLYYYAGLQCFQQAIKSAGTLDQSEIGYKLATEHFDTVLGDTWFEDANGNHPITAGGGVPAVECHPGQIGQWQNAIFEVIDLDDNQTAPGICPKPDWPLYIPPPIHPPDWLKYIELLPLWPNYD